jgi:hypothetical protein
LIRLAIGLNLSFASYYLLYKDNFILNGSENFKSLFLVCISEYLLVWALVKLLGKSQELTIYYTNYAYFGLTLVHLGLYHRFPKFFDIFLKFNFGFSYSYFLTIYYLQNYNFIIILTSSLVSVIWNYYDLLSLDRMTVYSTSFISSVALFEALCTIVYSNPIQSPEVGGCIGGIFISIIFYIFHSTVRTQLGNLENMGDS